MPLLFIGDDWAEDHHDVELQDETGRKRASAPLPEGVEGIAKLHALVARHGGEDLEPRQVTVGIETDRDRHGTLPRNAHYRERHAQLKELRFRLAWCTCP